MNYRGILILGHMFTLAIFPAWRGLKEPLPRNEATQGPGAVLGSGRPSRWRELCVYCPMESKEIALFCRDQPQGVSKPSAGIAKARDLVSKKRESSCWLHLLLNCLVHCLSPFMRVLKT